MTKQDEKEMIEWLHEIFPWLNEKYNPPARYLTKAEKEQEHGWKLWCEDQKETLAYYREQELTGRW